VTIATAVEHHRQTTISLAFPWPNAKSSYFSTFSRCQEQILTQHAVMLSSMLRGGSSEFKWTVGAVRSTADLDRPNLSAANGPYWSAVQCSVCGHCPAVMNVTRQQQYLHAPPATATTVLSVTPGHDGSFVSSLNYANLALNCLRTRGVFQQLHTLTDKVACSRLGRDITASLLTAGLSK